MCDGLAHQLLPDALEVVLLTDRGFADRDLMKYLKDKLGWHYRIRIKRHFYFQYRGIWQSVKSSNSKQRDRSLERELTVSHWKAA